MRNGLALVLASLLVGACGSDEDSGPCTAGTTVACTCDGGGAGVRTCGDEGAYGACACGDGHECLLHVTPTSLNFGELCLEAAFEHVVALENVGAAPCNVALELAGEDQLQFQISTLPLAVGIGERLEVPVTYHPTAAAGATPGAWHVARVRISTGPEEGREVALAGGTADAPAQPILSLDCPGLRPCNDPARNPAEACCRTVDNAGLSEAPYYGRTYLRSVDFGALAPGGEVTVPVEVQNLGCGPLELSALTVAPGDGGTSCAGSTVRVVTPLPLTVPGSASAQAREHVTVELRFAPTASCELGGGVTVGSNDPDLVASNPTAASWARFDLAGVALE